MINPSSNPSYLGFGYLPSGHWRADWRPRLFGAPNLMKRLQVFDILRALDVQPTDTVLDVGCASGYITVELAKLAKTAVGIDVLPDIEARPVPAPLAGRLVFKRASGAALPFPDNSFDRILASEVLPMLPDPRAFMPEIARVLKPGGALVVVNGLGPLPISDAYDADSPRLRALRARYPQRFPSSYDDYVRTLQRLFGTSQTRFLSESEIAAIVTSGGFRIVERSGSPRAAGGDWIAWEQFRLYLDKGEVLPAQNFFLRFLWLSLRSLFDRRDYRGGLILRCAGTKANGG
jgi:ubiquinone/menaquinone biosynthesis C-methylase UbiE